MVARKLAHDGSPMSSFHSSGRAAMNSVMSATHRVVVQHA